MEDMADNSHFLFAEEFIHKLDRERRLSYHIFSIKPSNYTFSLLNVTKKKKSLCAKQKSIRISFDKRLEDCVATNKQLALLEIYFF